MVPTRTFAGVLAELDIGRVDLAHIDVQGAELMALRGAGARLSDVRAVWLEVEAVELYRGQPLRQEVEQFMRAAGFRLALDTVGKVTGDQLWVNDSWRPATDT